MGLGLTITLLNQTQNTLSYVNGNVTVTEGSQSSVDISLCPYLAIDSQFQSDVGSTPASVLLSDGVNTYSGGAAIDYLKENFIYGKPPQLSSEAVSYTLAGFSFSVCSDASLPNTSENNLLYLVNPNGSGFNGRAMFYYFSTDSTQGILTARVYSNPIVSASGTPLAISNNLVSNSAPSSALRAYIVPTVINRGTKRISMTVTANTAPTLIDFKQTAVLTPGNSLLVSAQASNLGLLSSLSCHFFMQWVEI